MRHYSKQSALYRGRPLLERLEDRSVPSLVPGPTFHLGINNFVNAAVSTDFGRDGSLDLAVAQGALGPPGVSGLMIMPGAGDGSFFPIFSGSQLFFGGTNFSGVAAADLNSDGNADLVATVPTSNSVIALLGDGHAGFGQPISTLVPSNPQGVAIGDFNHDAKPDLVIANRLPAGKGGFISVLLGNGDGTFQPATQYAFGTNPTDVASGDLNNDGYSDIAFSDSGSGTVGVFLANPDGTFPPQQSYAVVSGPYSLTTGDFNGDGKPDLAAACLPGMVAGADAFISVLLNAGPGTFQPAQSYPLVGSPGQFLGNVVSGDFNSDGVADLATGREMDRTASVAVFAGKGDGTFQAPMNYPTGANADPGKLVVGDFNRDGRQDLVAASYRWDPPGTNETAVLQTFINARSVVVTGADAGGGPEVRVYDPGATTPRLDFNAYDPAFRGGVRVAAADFNCDGFPDIVTAPGPGAPPEIRVFDGVTGQLYLKFLAYDAGWMGGVYVSVGDFDGDGCPDVVTGAGAGGGPHVKFFRITSPIHVGGVLPADFMAYDSNFRGGVRVAAGDVNGDGIADIITGAGPGGGPHVKAFSGANGTVLASFMAYEANFRGGVNVAASDLSQDGFADIITGAGPGGGPHVKAFSGKDLHTFLSFYAYAPAFRGGVRVGAADLAGSLQPEIITGPGPGGGPHLRVLDATTLAPLESFNAFDPSFIGGIFVGGQ